MSTAMVYEAGIVYEKGGRIKKWYGQFRVYQRQSRAEPIQKSRMLGITVTGA